MYVGMCVCIQSFCFTVNCQDTVPIPGMWMCCICPKLIDIPPLYIHIYTYLAYIHTYIHTYIHMYVDIAGKSGLVQVLHDTLLSKQGMIELLKYLMKLSASCYIYVSFSCRENTGLLKKKASLFSHTEYKGGERLNDLSSSSSILSHRFHMHFLLLCNIIICSICKDTCLLHCYVAKSAQCTLVYTGNLRDSNPEVIQHSSKKFSCQFQPSPSTYPI